MDYQTKQNSKTPNKKRTRLHSALNGLLILFVAAQIGVIYFLNSKNSESNEVVSAPSIPADALTAAADGDDGAVESKQASIPAPSEAKPVQVIKNNLPKKHPSAKASSEVAMDDLSYEGTDKKVSDPWATEELAEKVDGAPKLKKSAKEESKEERMLVAAITDEVSLPNASTDAPALVEELNLSSKQASILAIKHQRLLGNLREADQEGAVGLRRMLINDHLAWAKEFLGREKYDRYVRASSNLLASTQSK